MRVYLGEVGFLPDVQTLEDPDIVQHTTEPALTLLGDPGMAAGRSLARAGQLFGSSADELIIGTAEGAWVVDVAAMLPPPGLSADSDLSVAEGARLSSPNTGPLVGLVVGVLRNDDQVAVWVGDGIRLHLFHDPLSGTTPSPSLTLTWNDPSAPTEMITAATAATWDNQPALVVGCSQCAALGVGPTLPGVVRVFDADDLFGSVDPDLSQAVASVHGPGPNGRFGQSLAAFSDGRLAIGSAGLSGSVLLTNPNSLSSMAVLAGSNSARLGAAIAIGDPNANGADDLIAGGPEALFGTTRFGMIRAGYEVPPAGTPPSSPTPQTIPSPWYMQGPGGSGSLGARFGQSVAVGDINGDDLDDILVGAPRAMDGAGNNLRTGVVYVILGGLENNTSAGEEIAQFLDPDGDGYGSGPQIIRCTLVGALQGGDCEEDVSVGVVWRRQRFNSKKDV